MGNALSLRRVVKLLIIYRPFRELVELRHPSLMLHIELESHEEP
jgi:hypothetical protein